MYKNYENGLFKGVAEHLAFDFAADIDGSAVTDRIDGKVGCFHQTHVGKGQFCVVKIPDDVGIFDDLSLFVQFILSLRKEVENIDAFFGFD